jgi:hypothetical protein
MADLFCSRVSRTFGEHAVALRPVAEFCREAGNLALAQLVEMVIRECVEASLQTYEDTPAHGIHPTDRMFINELSTQYHLVRPQKK